MLTAWEDRSHSDAQWVETGWALGARLRLARAAPLRAPNTLPAALRGSTWCDAVWYDAM